MTNLSFARRGPFRIAHFSAIGYIFSPPAWPLQQCHYMVGIRYSHTLVKWSGFIAMSWHRKPSRSDRGPFDLYGLIKQTGFELYTPFPLTYTTFILVRDIRKMGLTGAFLLTKWSTTHWIYYSRNISTTNA